MEAYRGEEKHHADVFDGAVKEKISLENIMEEKGQEGDCKASGNRRWNAQALQDRRHPGKEHSQEQGHNAHSRRHIHIQYYLLLHNYLQK